jgi:hypothetical protein
VIRGYACGQRHGITLVEERFRRAVGGSRYGRCAAYSTSAEVQRREHPTVRPFVELRALRESSTGGALRRAQGVKSFLRSRPLVTLRALRGVGAWFAANDAVGIVLWSLAPTALAAVAGCAVLRRATPMN